MILRAGAGVVEAVPSGESEFAVGDRVAFINPGTYAEYVCPFVGIF